MTGLAETLAGWPLFVSVAAAIAARELYEGRRRTVLNEALHELRRPLQALTLASGPAGGAADGVQSSVRLAAAALERLEREVNGEPDPTTAGEPVEARPLLEAAVRRWRSRASLDGGSLSLRWRAGDVVVEGDGAALAQAIDNLLVNAIEHGGPAVELHAGLRDGRLRIVVADSGRRSRPVSRRGSPAETIARLRGRRRRGHGLAVVRRVAAAHRGRFVLRSSGAGTVATLELPLAGGDRGAAA